MSQQNIDQAMRELFASNISKEDEEKEQNTSPTVAPTSDDATTSSQQDIPDELRSLFMSNVEQEIPEPAPTAPRDDMPSAEDVPIAPVVARDKEVIPTTLNQFYGEDLRRREQELLSRRMGGTGGTGEFTQVEEQPLTAEEQQELDNIQQTKQAKYDAVQGPNVSDYGAFGKVITDPDGSSRYLPPPRANESSQLALKFASDTLRGLAGLPEFIGMEGYQDFIPKVSSDDEAVIVTSELAQLTLGGMGAMKLADKAPKLLQLADKMPALQRFVTAGAAATPQTIKNAVELTRMSAAQLGRMFPTGTIPASIGMAAVADEDVATFMGDPNMTMAEAKTRMLAESLAFGVVLRSSGAVGEFSRLAPGARYLVRNVSAGMSALFASPKKADQIAVEKLGEIVFENQKRLAAAQTDAEISQIYQETYDAARSTYKSITGENLDDIVTGRSLPDPEGYVPTIGEVFGMEALLRLQKSLLTGSSKEKANEILRTMLDQNDVNRLEAMGRQQAVARSQLAPREGEAAEEVVEDLGPQLQQERQQIEALGQAERQTVQQRTSEQMRQLAEEEAATVATAIQAEEVAEQSATQAARNLQAQVEASPVARTNLDTLDQTIAQDGTVVAIDDALRADLATKSQLGDAKDAAYQSIQLPPEVTQDIVESVTGTFSNPTFLVGEAQIEAANRSLRKLINVFKKEADEVTPPPADPTPGTPPAPQPTPAPRGPIQERLAQLEAELADATTAQEIMRISEEIRKLMGRGGAIARSGADDVADLPTITARDLEDVILSVRGTAAKANEAALREGSRPLKSVADGLNQYANRLTEELDTIVASNPQAVAARDEFNAFFDGFKERWRTQTGKQWQGDMIGARTEVDTADVMGRITRVFANPNAKDSDIKQIQQIFDTMPPEVQQTFAQDIGTRILADFTRSKGVMPAMDEITSVRQARQVLSRLDSYLQGKQRYESVMPGALEPLRRTQAQLRAVVGPAEEAAERAATATAQRGATQKEAAETRKIGERELTVQEQQALSDINYRIREANKLVENSALAGLMNVDDPVTHVGKLLADRRGFTKFSELWSRAGATGDKLDSGITTTQLALRETLTEGLLNRVYTTREMTQESRRIALTDLAEIIQRPQSVQGRMLRLAYQDSPEGLELIERLGRTAASYQRSLTGRAVQRSPSAEVGSLQNLVTDIQMVAFGPLTKDFRLARFMTRAAFGATGAEMKVAEAFARVLTDPKYYKRVLDQADKLARQGMVTEQEAMSAALTAAMFGVAGIKKYMEMDDPREELLRDIRQYATIEQTPEALGQPVPSQDR